MPLSRREFLAATAAVPVLAGLRAEPTFAEEVRHVPPYLTLKKFIPPGLDDFPEEKEAAVIVSELAEAFRTGILKNEPTGYSPFPRSYKPIGPDLHEAIYDPANSNVGEGWKRWVRSFRRVRRADFYVLPDGVVRFEVAGTDGNANLCYRVGRWKQKWQAGKLVDFVPLEEQVATGAKTWFRDVTSTVFTGVSSFSEQLARGVPYWRARLDPASGIDIYGSNGIAVGDVDGDGVDEVYVCQPGGLPNRLYKFNSDGLLTDITEEWGAGILDDTSAALFLDLRNSGRQDLVLLRSGGPLLFLNEGGHFRIRDDAFRFLTIPQGNFTGMAAADYDRDGKLDLYLCCYVYFQSEAQYTYASPYHDAQNGPPNFLFRNRLSLDGSGYFEDVTDETGLNENNNRFSFAPAWCDFNADGWPDLFVANDFGRKNLYVNRSGHFRDLAASAGVEDIGPGMSASWFDYDGDGKPDLYVANMWTAAGQRVTADPLFVSSRTESVANAYHRHTMGNSLYRNRGDGTLEETTAKQRVGFGRWAWSSGGHDLNNDGQPEIFVTCGMLTNESTTDLNSFFWRQVVAKSPVKQQPSATYENGWNAINQFIREEYSWNGREPNVLHVRRGDRYFDFSGISGLDFADDSRAYAITDFDGDGKPDLILKSRLGPQIRVLQNDCAENCHSIGIELCGTTSNRDAVGARVRVDHQTKWLDAGSGFLSQHSKRLIFGLGSSETVSEVHILWPSGAEQRFQNLRAGHIHRFIEGSPEPRSIKYRQADRLAAGEIEGDNQLKLQDTWFLEPVPLPEALRGPGLFILTDLPKSSERLEQYEIFRRYLFDWRTELKLPFTLLLNQDGHAVKVYGNVPSEERVRVDLAQVNNGSRKGLPFEGNYVHTPHRDFFKFGAAFLWSGYPEQALPYLDQVLRRTPGNARVLVLVGQIHLQANRLDLAQKAFTDAAKANSSFAEAWSGLGDVCESRNNSQAALDNYEKALALKPDLLYTLLNAGRSADKLNQPAKAQEFYQRASTLDPQSPEALNGLGLALAKLGQAEEAGRSFKNAIALKRDYSEAINNLGVLYIQSAKVNDAIAAFEYGIRVAPDEDILYLNLGRTYTSLGKFDKAREVMHELLDRKPESMVARRALQDLDGR